MENQEERIKRMIERRDRENKYRNKYERDHYKRVTCLFPLDKVEILEQAASDAGMKTSTYIMSLVDADLKKRGLLK